MRILCMYSTVSKDRHIKPVPECQNVALLCTNQKKTFIHKYVTRYRNFTLKYYNINLLSIYTGN